MADFQIGGVAYQSKMMDGETQTLVLKRLLPAFTALIGAAPSLKSVATPAATPAPDSEASADPDDADEDESTANRTHDLLMPVARELAGLHDRDVQFIISACLAVTSRQAAGGGVGWAPVIQRGGIVQDQNDARFITRLTIAWRVLGENFGEMLASFGLDIEALTKVAPKAA